MNDLPKDIKEQAKKTFAKYDMDKSNFIDIRELRTLMHDVAKETGLPEPSDDDVYQILKDADTNKDKRISQEEFVDLYKVIHVLKNQNNQNE